MSAIADHRHLKNWGLSIVGTIAIFVLWQLVTGTFGLIDDLVLPSPLQVYSEFSRTQDLIFEHFWPTLTSSAIGFTIAVTLAIVVAVVLTLNDDVRHAIMPLVVGGNSIPRVSLAPVIIYYFGGFQAKYLLSAWIAFFPMLVNTLEGLDNIEDDQESMLKTFETKTWQEYRYVRFPAALPLLFDGMKISVSLAIVGAVVGEFIGAREGLGFLALFAIRNLNTSLVLATVGVMGLVSVTAFFALFVLQDRIVHWKETNMFTE